MKPTDRIPVTPELRNFLILAEVVLGGRCAAAVLFDVTDRTLLRISSGATPTISRAFGRKVAEVLRHAAGNTATLAAWFEKRFPEES